jgi:hypothetical protein
VDTVDDDFVGTASAAKLLQQTESTMRSWRYRGIGPRWFRLTDNGAVIYRRSTLLAFLADRERIGAGTGVSA